MPRPICCSTACSMLAAVLPMLIGDRAARADDGPASQLAGRIVASSGFSGGICAIVGCQDAELAEALAGQRSFVVHCLCADEAVRDVLRAEIRARGLSGRVSAEAWTSGPLPYADHLLNLVVIESQRQVPVSAEQLAGEVLRVLVPHGTTWVPGRQPRSSPAAAGEALDRLSAALGCEGLPPADQQEGWRGSRKPWPAGMDEWSHYLHGADGNPVADDLLVGPPRQLQWVAEPLWQRSHESDSSVSTLVTSGGRLFAIVDEAPISLDGDHPLPDSWSLIARDAFNGSLLWKVPIPRWGWREWKNTWFNTRPGDIPLNVQKRLVAAGNRVYVTLGYSAPVSQLDAATGAILQIYEGTERTNEILHRDGTLILSMLADEGVRLAAYDAASGARRWITGTSYRGSTTDYIRWATRAASAEPQRLDPSLNSATDGATVALIDGTEIVGIDFLTGVERWRTDFPEAPADHLAGGIKAGDNLWVGTLIVRDGVVLHASPHVLAALSAADGSVLWQQPKKYIGHLWYEWKDVFVIGGLAWTWSDELATETIGQGSPRAQRSIFPVSAHGYDLHTGALQQQVPLGPIFKTHHHHRCYRNKATTRYILASRRGTEFVDLCGGQHTVDNWVRGTCHVGMMPANGLQYVPPHPCACYLEEKLNGMLALAPERRSDSPLLEPRDPARLQRGPAYDEPRRFASADDDAADWPAFRHDNLRTGSGSAAIPDDAGCAWRVSLGGRLSPPTAAGQRVFVSEVDGQYVVCLDARDGHKLWEFAAGGRVDSPPTLAGGLAVFGSSAGSVTCVRAGDGQLVWRFQAAPARRLIAAFGQLESAWPVPGSVLVIDGTVYFTAGRSSQLDGGLHLYGLELATGRVLHHRLLEGPHYDSENIEENFELPQGSLPDILVSDGQRLFLRTAAFDRELSPSRGQPEMRAFGGFQDDAYFKRTPWTLDGDYARLIVRDERSIYYVRMFDSLRGLDPTVYFTPGKDGYLLFAKEAGARKPSWSRRVPVRIRAMAKGGERLYTAGPPDIVDPQDPLAAFQGRKGGLLHIVDAGSGEQLAEHPLPSPPVFNGIAVASGRLYLSLEDGSLACFASTALP